MLSHHLSIIIRLIHSGFSHCLVRLLIEMALIGCLKLSFFVLPMLRLYWRLAIVIDLTHVPGQHVLRVQLEVNVRIEPFCLVELSQLLLKSSFRIFWHQWFNSWKVTSIDRIVAWCGRILDMMSSDQFSQLLFLVIVFLLMSKGVLMILESDGVHGHAVGDACLFESDFAQVSWLVDFVHVCLIVF